MQVFPQSQPQNIYQQLGKPQPQPHLQGHPTYQQSSALGVQPQGWYTFSQQLPAQLQTTFPLGAPDAPPQTPYQGQTLHISPQTPYPQSQTPYLPSQPSHTQSQVSYPLSQTPYTSSQTQYQRAQYPGQQQSQQVYPSQSQLQVSYVPQTSFTSQTPAAVPTSSSGSSWRVPASWPPPVARSATLAQQAHLQVQTQLQPQATSQTPAQRPLPQPSTGANAPILPFASQSAVNPSPGSSKPFPTLAIQATVVPSSDLLPPKRGRPLPTPTGTAGKQAISLANFAFSTQSSISSQPQQITTNRPSKRPLPAPSSNSPVKKSESVGLSRTSSFSIQNSASSASSLFATPKRKTAPPKFQSQPSSELSSGTKENAPASSLPSNKFSGLPAVSAIPKSTSTTTLSSISTTSATTSNSSVPPPKKFTPTWRHTIPHYPAPAWGYAVGMVGEPHPKPKAQVPPQPAPSANEAKVKLKKEQNTTLALHPPPPPVPAVPLTKGTTQHQQYSRSQYRQLGQPGSMGFIQSGVQQRHTYQQQQQAYYGHARSPATYSETQDEDEEDSEDSEEETDSDEEDEDDDEDEEQPDPRYNPQNKPQKYTRPMASIASGAGVPSQSLSRGYDQTFEALICTPKRKLRLNQKVKMNKMDPYTAYIDINTTNGHKSQIVPWRGRDDPQSQVTPKAAKIILKPKKRILSEKQVGFGAVKHHTVYLWDASDDDGRGERKRFQVHERSRSSFEREREVAIVKQRRQLERKAGSAFSVDDERIIRRRQEEDDREVGLTYEYEEEEGEDTRMRRRQVMKDGTPRGTRRKGQGQLRDQGSSLQWDIRDIPANRQAGPTSVTRYDITYEDGKEDEEDRYVHNNEKEWDPSPILKLTNRRFQESGSTAMVCDIAGGTGVSEKSMKGGQKWKSTPLKYDRDGGGEGVGGRRKLEMQYHQQEMTRKFGTLRMNDRSSLIHNQGSTGWPADLPRLPRTPGSSSGSVTDDGGDYFDIQSQPVSVVSPVYELSSKQLRSAGISGKMNISLADPRPRVTVRSSSLDLPVLISRRQPLPQPPRHPENQTYSTSGIDDRIWERLQLRRSLYSDSDTMQMREEEGLKKRPQSQIYVSATTQIQAPIGARNQQQQPPPHLPFSNKTMHNSSNYLPQTLAPLPIIGIESPHPVGSRDKLAGIPMLEEGSTSNDESEGEHRQQPNHRRVQVRNIDVASDPSSPPRIQLDGSGPSIPNINLDSSPRMNSTINNDSGPIINIDPPRINVDDGNSIRGGNGPNISVSEPGAQNFHSYHAQSVSQQPQFGEQQTHGRQARPAGGLICGGCNGSIIGRIVSAMGSRWHPACFRCTVCNELLEHVSSYEHEGRPYCHLDYHENFAPRCYSCKTTIIEEQFISLDDPALGKKTYHTQHFFCAECGDPFFTPSESVSFPDSKGEVALSGDGEFEGFTVYKGHPYCEPCHVRLRLPKCRRCKRSIRDYDEAVEALGGKWCWGCFVCATCGEPFENPSFFQRDDKPFCERCFSIMLRNEV